MASSAATGMGKKHIQSGLGSSLSKVDDEVKSAVPPGEGAISEEEEQAQKEKDEDKTRLWMDFDDFSVCFKSIIVYHKPCSFKFNEKYSDLRVCFYQVNLKSLFYIYMLDRCNDIRICQVTYF